MRVLTRTSLTNILENYAQVVVVRDEKTGRRTRTQIWPRYHQLDVVRQLLADAAVTGAGRRYLIQHSAGSGKSNSIAWLAHQLIGITKDDGPVFDSIIVVTDRRILDRQIGDTIRQYAQVGATVGRAKRAGDLRRFIEAGKKIIISTVQKFPFILDEIGDEQRKRRFAIIIDEAHSSQGGRTSASMSAALGKAGEEVEEETPEDRINRLIESRKLLPNASYFAFTATPKNKTLEVAVKWDTTYEQSVAPQKRWATVTVAKVPDTLLRAIVGGKGRKPIVVDAVNGRIATALERKGQVILYGPPGTGKTYQARRFAVWWLLRQIGHEGAYAVLGDSDRLREAERELSTSQVSSRVWWVVANPKQWSWDRLFRDGKVDYRYGRLKRNYPLVQRGDLVIGYQSTPDKRVVALARVSREFQSVGNNPPTIELEPVEQLDQGLSYDELKQDAVLAQSEPMRFNNQGTLFALTEIEAEYLFVQLAERHPQRAVLEQAGDSGTMAGVGPLTRVTFHPSYTYEDFIEGFRPDASGAGGLSLALEDGVFKRVCRAAQANPGRPYLLLIDEINRGNVAKIMGELLTLLERDKRGLTLTLPQSKETFSVPRNVFLMGTMNTADRSIKLLDAALRRRFAFLECMPDSDLLHGATVGDLALDDFLDGLNQRIARFEGREKQVGHSYLLVDGQPVDEVEEFAARFREEILPLLQEYCYDEYATLAKFIGSELVDADAGTLDAEKVDDAEQLVAALAREFGESGVSSA